MGACLYLLAFAIILAVATAGGACPASDRDALLALKAGLNEPYLGILDTWTGNDCCHNWHGISCNAETMRVADINLRGESEDPIYERAHRSGYMTGSISPAICNLTGLAVLVVADWKGISGPIPRCVTSLPSLRILDLIGNKFTGRIPPYIGRLHELTLRRQPPPPHAPRPPKQQALRPDPRRHRAAFHAEPGPAEREPAYGDHPLSFANIYRLADLDLSLNRLSGQLPDMFGKMPVLATLNLDGNLITGPIPPSLLNSGVSILNLSRNSIEGRIPDVFGPGSYFMAIDLSYNMLSGPIPKSISAAAYIGHLDLAHNQLCGPIPDGPPFDHLDADSFLGNTCLCGKPLSSC
ncbi:hypothetical protein Dimus_037373 [Dionaea muscipula]